MIENHTENEIWDIVETGEDELCRKIFPLVVSAANDRNTHFANLLSDWLRYGRHGIEIDTEKSRVYLDVAVQGLIPDAIYDKGLALDGDTDADNMQAFSYFVLAAILGDTNAIEAVSDYFLYGTVVKNNDFISGALRKHSYYLKHKQVNED